MPTIKEYTMEGWISAFRSEKNKISDFAWKKLISDGQSVMLFSDETILSKYSTELSEYLTKVKLTPAEQHYYAYNPRLFSYEIYGIPEFWYLVLYANEIQSMLQFNMPVVRFYGAGVVEVLNAIRDLERDSYDAMEHGITTSIVGRKAVNNSRPLHITV